MSNVVTNKTNNNMHSHIENSYQIIDDYLPSSYVGLVLGKLLTTSMIKLPSSRTIRNVKNKYEGYENHIIIIKALVEVALDNKEALEGLKKLVKS